MYNENRLLGIPIYGDIACGAQPGGGISRMSAGLSHPSPSGARQSAMPGTDGRAGVRGKARFTHDMTFFRHDVRRKRFSTHGELYSMEITIRKNHVAEKPRAG